MRPTTVFFLGVLFFSRGGDPACTVPEHLPGVVRMGI